MPEEPVEAYDSTRSSFPLGAEGAPDATGVVPTQTSRMVARAEPFAALIVFLLVAALGVPLGWVWSWLAPPQDSTMSREGELVPVLVERFHEFDGLAIFMLLGAAVGVLVAAALWMFGRFRGPLVLGAAVLGCVLSAWVGMRTGTWFAALLYPQPAEPQPGELVKVAPQLHTLAAVLVQPLALALVYGFAASWNGYDDLRRS